MEKILTLIDEFEKYQESVASSGAADTEPDTEFQLAVAGAFSTTDVRVPNGSIEWKLYAADASTDEEKAEIEAIAVELTARTRELVRAVQSISVGESLALRDELRKKLLRVDID